MTPEAIAVTAATSSTGGVLGAAVVAFLLLISIVVKLWNWSKETSAQGILYSQLSELVQKQREELASMYIHRTTLQEQLFELRHKVETMQGYESTVEVLKQKLDQKDLIIAERDSKINMLLQELLKMKDRVHSLELRLKADEAKFCEGCTFKGNIQHIPFIEGGRDA